MITMAFFALLMPLMVFDIISRWHFARTTMRPCPDIGIYIGIIPERGSDGGDTGNFANKFTPVVYSARATMYFIAFTCLIQLLSSSETHNLSSSGEVWGGDDLKERFVTQQRVLYERYHCITKFSQIMGRDIGRHT